MRKIKKVLLIDDSEATNHMNEFLLKETGWCESIDIVTNGQKALHYFNDNLEALPELIFLDIKMPVMDGFEFLDEIKPYKERLLNTVVIIMLSSSISPIDEEKAKEYEYISEFLKKPLTMDKVEAIFRKYYA